MALKVHSPDKFSQDQPNPNYKPLRTHTTQANHAQAEVPTLAITNTAKVNACFAQLAWVSEEL